MEITNYELFEVPPRWLFLRLETDDGLTGWGEPIVEGRSRTVRTAVEELLENYLIGEDARRIEDHWQMLYRGGFYRGGPVLMSAIAGIDQALWDIKGKYYDAPVYELLGGRCRDKTRVYQWIGGDRPADLAREAEDRVQEGYTAVKMDAVERLSHVDSPTAVDEAVERANRVREVVGDDVDICVDFRGRVSTPMARRLARALEPVEPMFVEEPVLPEYNDNLPDVANVTTVPIATGDRMYTRMDFKPLFASGAINVAQPAVSHAGGITEVTKIASMADAHDVSVALNCPLGPIALAASLQVSLAIPNFLVLDHGFDISQTSQGAGHDYIEGAFEFEDGFVNPPDSPGLGISVDEETVRRRTEHDSEWHNPVWRHEDGSVAEW